VAAIRESTRVGKPTTSPVTIKLALPAGRKYHDSLGQSDLLSADGATLMLTTI
jgi:hypothetical protein